MLQSSPESISQNTTFISHENDVKRRLDKLFSQGTQSNKVRVMSWLGLVDETTAYRRRQWGPTMQLCSMAMRHFPGGRKHRSRQYRTVIQFIHCLSDSETHTPSFIKRKSQAHLESKHNDRPNDLPQFNPVGTALSVQSWEKVFSNLAKQHPGRARQES